MTDGSRTCESLRLCVSMSEDVLNARSMLRRRTGDQALRMSWMLIPRAPGAPSENWVLLVRDPHCTPSSACLVPRLLSDAAAGLAVFVLFSLTSGDCLIRVFFNATCHDYMVGLDIVVRLCSICCGVLEHSWLKTWPSQEALLDFTGWL